MKWEEQCQNNLIGLSVKCTTNLEIITTVNSPISTHDSMSSLGLTCKAIINTLYIDLLFRVLSFIREITNNK